MAIRPPDDLVRRPNTLCRVQQPPEPGEEGLPSPRILCGDDLVRAHCGEDDLIPALQCFHQRLGAGATVLKLVDPSCVVQSDAQWFGNALIVEHRYAWGLAVGMKDEGLVLA